MHIADEWAILGWATAVYMGAVVGSFLTVVTSRLPAFLSWSWRRNAIEDLDGDTIQAGPMPPGVISPASSCPCCNRALRWPEKIPILSYLVLRGHCAGCGWQIPRRYLYLELTGVFLACVAYWRYGATLQAGFAAIALWWLLAIGLVDLETCLIPPELAWPLAAAGLLANLVGGFVPLSHAVLGVIVGYLAGAAIRYGWRWARGREGLGGGDPALIAAMGAWVGVLGLEPALMIAALLALFIVGGRRFAVREPAGASFPFGPFLALGTGISLVVGPWLIMGWPALLAGKPLLALHGGL